MKNVLILSYFYDTVIVNVPNNVSRSKLCELARERGGKDLFNVHYLVNDKALKWLSDNLDIQSFLSERMFNYTNINYIDYSRL